MLASRVPPPLHDPDMRCFSFSRSLYWRRSPCSNTALLGHLSSPGCGADLWVPIWRRSRPSTSADMHRPSGATSGPAPSCGISLTPELLRRCGHCDSSGMRREERPHDVDPCAHCAPRAGLFHGPPLPPETRQSSNDRELRDTFRLLLTFVHETVGIAPSALCVPNLDAPRSSPSLTTWNTTAGTPSAPGTFACPPSGRSFGLSPYGTPRASRSRRGC